MKITLKYIIYISILVSSINTMVFGQDDCVLKLQEAQKLYNDGKIEQIPALLNPCIRNGFDKENKIQALRLLTLVFLFEDNYEDAEDAMLQILKLDPEYKVNKSVDAVNYIRLFKLFNTDPFFSVGLMFGFNNTYPMLIEPIGSNSFDSIDTRYTNDGISISVGLRATYHWTPKFELTFEPAYQNSKFSFSEDITSYQFNTGNEQGNYLNIPLLGTYSFYELKESKFFAELGFSYSIFLSGSQEVTSSYVNNTSPSAPTPSFSTNDLRVRNNYFGIIGIGSKVNMNRSFLQLGLRYSLGFNNVVNKNLINSQSTNYVQWNNHHIDSYFRLSSLMFTISYNYEFFKPKR